jgi:endonuclease/exonuclease/phosphatase family metal-dependent hydrolase
MIKFMTYNILDGGIGREEYILQVLQATQPDIILLQEVLDADFINRLAQTLNMNHLFVKGNSKRHLGLLSRFPIISHQNHRPFPPIRRAILEAEIEYLPSKRLSLFGVHLMALHGFLFECWRYWEIKIILDRVKLKEQNLCLIAGDFNAIASGDRVIVKTMPLFLNLLLLPQGWHIFKFALRPIVISWFYRLLSVFQSKRRRFYSATTKAKCKT